MVLWTGWTDAHIRSMSQGRFLEYADALDRMHRRHMLTQASFLGMAIGGGEEGAWQELWESTMSQEELQAEYDAGFEELSRRAQERGTKV